MVAELVGRFLGEGMYHFGMCGGVVVWLLCGFVCGDYGIVVVV